MKPVDPWGPYQRRLPPAPGSLPTMPQSAFNLEKPTRPESDELEQADPFMEWIATKDHIASRIVATFIICFVCTGMTVGRTLEGSLTGIITCDTAIVGATFALIAVIWMPRRWG